MKLIDKDSLIEIMNCNKPLADGYHMKDYVFDQIMHDIDSEPTIEAIPILWIEKKIADIKDRPNDDDISAGYEVWISEVWGWLLEDWRKDDEKEKKISNIV